MQAMQANATRKDASNTPHATTREGWSGDDQTNQDYMDEDDEDDVDESEEDSEEEDGSCVSDEEDMYTEEDRQLLLQLKETAPTALKAQAHFSTTALSSRATADGVDGSGAMERALALNLEMQQVLREQLAAVEAELVRNEQARASCRAAADLRGGEGASASRRGRSNAGRDWSPHGLAFGEGDDVPAPNADMDRMLTLVKECPTAADVPNRPRNWRKVEQLAMLSAVRRELISRKHARLLRMQMDEATSQEKMTEILIEIQNLPKDDSLHEEEVVRLMQEDPLGVDFWEGVSRHMDPRTRTAAECRARWEQVDDVRLSPFSEQDTSQTRKNVAFDDAEQMLLESLVEQYGGHEWEKVAAEMSETLGQRRRSAMACMRAYKTMLNARQAGGDGKRRVWSEDENIKLQAAVAELGSSNWQLVSDRIGFATPNQCLQRWRYSLNPSMKKGKWTLEEDRLLIAACHQLGPKPRWCDVAMAVPGRTDRQCRERFRNRLDPDIKRSWWTKEEDERLLDAVALFPDRWAAIARHAELVGRTDVDCKRRWLRLTYPSEHGGGPNGADASTEAAAAPASEVAIAAEATTQGAPSHPASASAMDVSVDAATEEAVDLARDAAPDNTCGEAADAERCEGAAAPSAPMVVKPRSKRLRVTHWARAGRVMGEEEAAAAAAEQREREQAEPTSRRNPRRGCKQCAACTRKPCGKCGPCVKKHWKEKCLLRRCTQPVTPAQPQPETTPIVPSEGAADGQADSARAAGVHDGDVARQAEQLPGVSQLVVEGPSEVSMLRVQPCVPYVIPYQNYYYIARAPKKQASRRRFACENTQLRAAINGHGQFGGLFVDPCQRLLPALSSVKPATT